MQKKDGVFEVIILPEGLWVSPDAGIEKDYLYTGCLDSHGWKWEILVMQIKVA